MIWLAATILAALSLAPSALALRRGRVALGRREAALALHYAQLMELDRTRDEGLLDPTEHASAVLEVQRRLLAAGGRVEIGTTAGAPMAAVAALLLVPVVGLALYAMGGSPDLPAAPLSARIQAEQLAARQEDALIARLHAMLAKLSPSSPKYRQGYLLLGSAAADRGRMAEAAQAWATALRAKFDPTLAMEAAEAEVAAIGHVTDHAAALLRRALRDAPPDAPWRPVATRRLDEYAAAGKSAGALPGARGR